MSAPTEAAQTAMLRVNLQSVQIKRKDGAVEDDFKTWAHTAIVTTTGSFPKFWYHGEADANFSKTSVTNGFEASYNFVRQSKPIPITDQAFSEVIDSQLIVSIFKGGNRDPTKGDQIIGWFGVELHKLTTDKLKGSFTLLPPSSCPVLPAGSVASPVEYHGSVTANFRGDAAFDDFVLGSRILRLDDLTMHNVPRRWRIPQSDWEDAEDSVHGSAAAEAGPTQEVLAAVEDPEENSSRYVITLAFPGKRQIALANGQLRLKNYAIGAAVPAVVTQPAAVPARPGSGSAQTAPLSGRAVPGDWKWEVQWKPYALFMSKPFVNDVIAYVQSGQPLSAIVRRVATEMVEEEDPIDTVYGLEAPRRLVEEDLPYRCTFSITLDALLASGASAMATEVSLAPVSLSDAEKAAEAAAKSARDASWAEYLTAKAKAGGGKAAGKKPVKAAKDAKAKDSKDKAKDSKAKAAATGKKSGKDAKKDDAPAAEEVAAPTPLHPYLANGTFMSLKLQTNVPLRPRPATPPPPKITAADLLLQIPSRPAALKAPPGLDASQEFRREISNFVAEIAQQYLKEFGTAAESSSGDEAKRRELLASIKSAGLYDKMKATLKATCLKIVRERFAHMPGATDPAGSRGRDMFISYLYAYMIGQMHAALNATFVEAEVVSSFAPVLEQQGQAVEAAKDVNDEIAALKYRRMALECEYSGRYARAERVHQMRVTTVEEAAAKGKLGGRYDVSAWHDYGSYYARRGALLKSVTCFREALSIDATFMPSLVHLAAVQGARGQLDDAHVFADSAACAFEAWFSMPNATDFSFIIDQATNAVANTAPLIFGVHSFVLYLKNKASESGHALLKAVNSYRFLLLGRGASPDEVEQAATGGAIYLIVSRFLLALNLNVLARKTLELAGDALTDTDAPKIHQVELLVLRSKWYLQTLQVLQKTELYENTETGANGFDSSTMRSPLTYTANNVEVPVSVAGAAYDGAPITSSQAKAMLDRAVDLLPGCVEACWMRAQFFLSGLPEDSQVRFPVSGAPDIADLSLSDVVTAVKDMRAALIAPSEYAAAPGYAGMLLEEKASFSAGEPSTVALVSTFLGVGGGAFCEDEFREARCHMQLASIYLHLSTVDASEELEELGTSLLHLSKDEYLKAADACKRTPSQGVDLSASYSLDAENKPWAVTLLGLGRVAWSLGDAVEAEALLSEANVLDNQNPVVWAWLAFLCLHASPIRDNEAAAAVDQSLRLGLVGDENETASLLHSIAEQYLNLGQRAVAIDLLRRATVHLHHSSSLSHLESLLQASIKLGAVLADDGHHEDAIKLLKEISTFKLPASRASTTSHLLAIIRNVRKEAAVEVSELLTKFGRQDEAKIFEAGIAAAGNMES